MPVKLICASHSPLMEFASPQEQRKEQIVRDTFAQLSAEVKAYDPTLIITFGPDHFNGFFYDLMPSFCVGIRATAAGDWDYGKDNDKINVPEDKIGTFKVYGPVGCENCKGGYKGRVGIYEVVKNTPSLQRIIMEDGNSIDIAAQMRKDGFNDLRRSGLLKVIQGVTSLEEVNRVTKD